MAPLAAHGCPLFAAAVSTVNVLHLLIDEVLGDLPEKVGGPIAASTFWAGVAAALGSHDLYALR